MPFFKFWKVQKPKLQKSLGQKIMNSTVYEKGSRKSWNFVFESFPFQEVKNFDARRQSPSTPPAPLQGGYNLPADPQKELETICDNFPILVG